MKATITKMEPFAADYVHLKIEGAESKSDAESFIQGIRHFDDATIHYIEDNEDGSYAVVLRGEINLSKLFEGQTISEGEEL